MITEPDRGDLEHALEVIKQTDHYEQNSYDPDNTVTRAVMHLRDALDGKQWA